MKVFIVFLALMTVFSGMFVFRSDMNRYIMLQKKLKILAEECARAAAMCVDTDRSAALGRTVIDYNRGQAAAEKILESTGLLDGYSGEPEGSGSYGSTVPKGDAVCVQVTVSPEGPSGARADVCWKGPDLFRLSFINKKTAEMSAAYEWK